MTKQIVRAYRSARKRLILSDYDGVLRAFASRPELAVPTPGLLRILARLAGDRRTTVVIVSGRPARDLEAWLGHLPVTLVAEHGAQRRLPGEAWRPMIHQDESWKTTVRPLLEEAVAAVPNSFIEEKTTSLVWHFRQAADTEAAETRARQLTAQLQSTAQDHGLRVTHSHRIVETRTTATDKGSAIRPWLSEAYDFVLIAGDDITDEDMFAVAAADAYTVKIGAGETRARIRLPSAGAFLKVLGSLAP